MITVKQAYLKCREVLKNAEIENEAFDALCLFEKATGLDRLGIISRGGEELSDEKFKYLMEITRRRADHEPLQYLIGRWSFCGFDFYVGRGVLIPRDDTEVVVNLCLDFIKKSSASTRNSSRQIDIIKPSLPDRFRAVSYKVKKSSASTRNSSRQVDIIKPSLPDRFRAVFCKVKNSHAEKALDLCAGSGAICVALSKLTNIDATAVEFSDAAFEFLKKNIAHNNAKVKPVKGDIFKCHGDFEDGTFDLIVSNPPYIKSEEIPTLQEEVRREPSIALDGGISGYDFYEAIIDNWSSKLAFGGALAFELGEGQFDYVKSLMSAKGYGNFKSGIDLGGVQRAIIGTKL